MKLVHQILACLVTAAMILLVLEGGLRLIGLGPKPTMNRFDSALGWTKEPGASIRRHTGEFDVTLRTNSRGLREHESVTYENPSGRKRVLVVGDSFTLGYTVEEPDTIPSLLESQLRDEGRDVEVLNGGTEGWSTDQEALWLAREGKRYDPDVVVLQMYENDIFWNGQDGYLRYPKPRLPAGGAIDPARLPPLADPGLQRWWVRRTALGSLVHKLLWPEAVPLLPGPRPLPAEWGPRLEDGGPGWSETAAALSTFAATAREIGAAPLVLVIPDKAQIDPEARERVAEMLADPRYDPERPFAGMVERARGAGLTVIDPREALRARNGEPLYFERDWHTNATGNRILAAALAEALAAPGLLGPAPHAAPPLPPAVHAAEPSGPGRVLLIAGAIWLVLGTLYLRRFPEQGWLGSYLPVAALVGTVLLVIYGIGWISGFLPRSIQAWVPSLAVAGILGAVLWYLRKRLAVMAELFGTFVRRGQWYVLPVLAGLLSVGALLVVAASSPWLAPFIYTLF
ncbi:MAG: hypothetical protein FJ144_17815 [Deltaproteobacteria bacterium]|nr:hypothetical protein [Deltaproteobacteria bacterium]